MGTKTLSQVIGGSHGIRLAPDLLFPKNKIDTVAFVIVSAIDASAGLTVLLNLIGAFEIRMLRLSALTTNDIARIKLTVDGVVIWDVDPVTNNATSEVYIGENWNSNNGKVSESIICDSNFKFEVETDADTSITLDYAVRPIL